MRFVEVIIVYAATQKPIITVLSIDTSLVICHCEHYCPQPTKAAMMNLVNVVPVAYVSPPVY